MGPIRSDETSVLTHITPHNNPEDGMIELPAAEAYDLAFSLLLINFVFDVEWLMD